LSRSISTVDIDSPTWKYGRHWRSMTIHLYENTVDIDSRYWFTQLKIRLMSHRPSISGKISRNRPVMWIHTKEKLVDRVFPRSRKKGPLTYGPIRGEKWSWTHVHQEVMVPCVVRNGPNTYPNIDTYPLIYRPVQLVTVDIDGRCWFTNGKILLILTVDDNSSTENYGHRRWKIDIILWSISLTTPVHDS